MDKLLATLGHPLRLGIVEFLLTSPPISQEQLRADLRQDKGTMSKALGPLLAEGVVRRDRARGPLYIPDASRTRALLQAAADLAEVITAERAREAAEQAQRLRRGRLRVVRDETA